eukprot:TRINITY_DN2737_c0_g1_i2.p1 TRINITY_DN2737_c0_g1~~TRINITY_DN2737_c0_g1_i2.p1  ORF type:complete len:1264 (+),score=298.63 TRINITY_DN2737_c0_g1_i2:79-3870(+)
MATAAYGSSYMGVDDQSSFSYGTVDTGNAQQYKAVSAYSDQNEAGSSYANTGGAMYSVEDENPETNGKDSKKIETNGMSYTVAYNQTDSGTTSSYANTDEYKNVDLPQKPPTNNPYGSNPNNGYGTSGYANADEYKNVDLAQNTPTNNPYGPNLNNGYGVTNEYQQNDSSKTPQSNYTSENLYANTMNNGGSIYEITSTYANSNATSSYSTQDESYKINKGTNHSQYKPSIYQLVDTSTESTDDAGACYVSGQGLLEQGAYQTLLNDFNQSKDQSTYDTAQTAASFYTLAESTSTSSTSSTNQSTTIKPNKGKNLNDTSVLVSEYTIDDLPNFEQDWLSLITDDKNTSSKHSNTTSTKKSTADFDSFIWNEKLQLLLERPIKTIEEQKQRVKDLNSLSESFVRAATPIVKQIVEEVTKKNDEKMIKSVDVGGIAGGEKFIKDNLFIKFAKDDETYHLYGGDEFAQKSAGHELKSLNSLISCNIANLHFPLMAMIDYLGYRVVVISKLPVTKNTLRYGSADAGKHIKNDEIIGRWMKQAARTLNIKPHSIVEGSSQKLVLLHAPVDIEGHLGTDGRCYLIDTARLFPPATPHRDVQGSHLFRLLRPESVKKSPYPLSSDAFTAWGREGRKIDNEQVINVTNNILNKEVLAFSKSEEFKTFVAVTSRNNEKESLSKLLHKRGINARLLGILVHFLNKEQSDFITQALPVVWTEIVARSLRAILKTSMREMPNQRTQNDYNQLVAQFLTDISSIVHDSNLTSRRYHSKDVWGEDGRLRWSLLRKFLWQPYEGISKPEEQKLASRKAVLPSQDLLPLIKMRRLIIMLLSSSGITLQKAKQAEVEGWGKDTEIKPFNADDIMEIGCTYKYLTILPFLTGFGTMSQSGSSSVNESTDGKGVVEDDGKKQFEEAEKYYKEELSTKSKELGNLHPAVAMTLMHLGELYKDRNMTMMAERVLSRAVQINEKYYDGEITMELARALERRTELYAKNKCWAPAEADLKKAMQIRQKVNTPELLLTDLELANDYEILATIQLKKNPEVKDDGYWKEIEAMFKASIKIKRNFYASQQQVNASQIDSIYNADIAQTEIEMFQMYFLRGDLEQAQNVCDRITNTLFDQPRDNNKEFVPSSVVAAAFDRQGQLELFKYRRGLSTQTISENQKHLKIAKERLQNALQIKIMTLGAQHSSVAETLEKLGYTFGEKFDEALESEKCYRKALSIYIKTIGEEQEEILYVMNNLGVFLYNSTDTTSKRTSNKNYDIGSSAFICC